MNQIRSLSINQTNQKVYSLVTLEDLHNKKVLDVGAGEGFFVSILGNYIKEQFQGNPQDHISACDLNPDGFKYDAIECQPADFHNPLPYDDNQFDIVTSIEVIEHLEDQFKFIRELRRVVKPGGKIIVTTPNILNINSRIRAFSSGFGLLFNILPLRTNDPTMLGGHIHPISLYYLGYAFYREGFQDIDIHYDRLKKSGLFLSCLFYPIIQLLYKKYRLKISSKYTEFYSDNKKLLDHINSIGTLSARTIIVVGEK